jgi:lysozyme family protein
MTDFNQAFKITMHNECGFSDNIHDRGGETWRGIARNFWPKWPGWPIIDAIRLQHPANINEALENAADLEPLVLAFYKTAFWDTLLLTSLDDQQIANQLFDISVNMGTGIAARFLQEAVNTFPGNALTVDGEVGSLTISAANKANPEALYNKINELRAQRYEHIIAEDPSQAVFRKSWFSRIKPYDTSETNTQVIA